MSETIPGILYRLDPTVAAVPLVFDSPHSGTAYPEDFRFACPLDALRTAEDTHVDALYAAAPAQGATLIAALFPRSYIDVNRDVGDIDLDMLEGAWKRKLAPSAKTRLGMGLIRRLAKPNFPIYDRKLAVAEVEGRIRRCYAPYHATLQAVCDRLHRQFGKLYHLDCHSMPSTGGTRSGEEPDARRADFVLGDRDGTTCAPHFTDLVAGVLRGMGYHVRLNDPYKGVELVRRHGRPREGRHSLQIEVNRRLYMNEKTRERNDNFVRLQVDLTGLVAALADVARAEAPPLR